MDFSIKLMNLYEEVVKSFLYAKAIIENGEHSEHTNAVVVKIEDEDLMFNLENGRYLTEVSQYKLFDNKGYQYSFDVLNYEQLCELADYVQLKGEEV